PHHLDDGAAEDLGIDGLGEMRAKARLERTRARMLAGERRDRYRRHVARIHSARHLTHQPVTVLARHRDIADDRIRMRRQKRFEPTLGGLRDEDRGAAQLEHRPHHLSGIVVVLDDEHRGAFQLHGRPLYTNRLVTVWGNFFLRTMNARRNEEALTLCRYR